MGSLPHDADRIEIADLNGDRRPDIAISEERYPGAEPDVYLVWFESPKQPAGQEWKRHTVVVEYSLNNLDVADMDGDGDLHIVSIAWDEYRDLHLWRNDAIR